MTDSHLSPSSDMKAAFTGLVLGAVVIFFILYGIVRLTNAHYASEPPAAGASQ